MPPNHHFHPTSLPPLRVSRAAGEVRRWASKAKS